MGVPIHWFFSVFPPQSVALSALVIAIVAATGLALGSFRIRGFSLGIPGVMFTGLAASKLLSILMLWLTPPGETPKPALDPAVLAFVRDFGLILFVYAVGVQVGPGFLASLRKRGLPLNLMAASIVLLGAILAVTMAYVTPKYIWPAAPDPRQAILASTGLFAGATTNAPALGSASEALKSIHGPKLGTAEGAAQTTPAFAIAYPFGLVGVILAMVLLRGLFRTNPKAEAAQIDAAEKAGKPELHTLNIKLKNSNLNGLALRDIPAIEKTSVVVSRILHRGHVQVATPDSKVELDDVLLAVGPPEELRDLQLIVGEPASIDLRAVPSGITTRPILVTHREVLGKTVDELDLPRRRGVTITRVSRAGMEFTAVGNLRLQFGDRVRGVGEAEALDGAAKELGDSVRDLNLPRLLPIFVGILLGVFIGSLPVFVPGLPAPVKLGLASGPMIIAIILARIGRVGPLIWYMPHNASGLLREFGIVLFLIAVALLAGDGFFNALQTPVGLYWLAFGAIITLVPLMIVGLVARLIFKVDYLHVCGLLCGSMTSPSLAFTQTMTSSEAPAVAFATVYPLTMILRVLTAQLLILIFA